MTDYFDLFSERRRPWIAENLLKGKFLALSAQCHPDRFHNATEEEKAAAQEHYAQLNAAFQCLREPKDRLRHLLELERGTKLKDIETLPPGGMNLFFEIAQTCREIDAFLAEKAKTVSPLLQARKFEEGLEWTERLNQLQSQVNSLRNVLLSELDVMNAVWEVAPPPGSPERAQRLPLKRLEEIYRILSYINRWTGHIQERVVQLSF